MDAIMSDELRRSVLTSLVAQHLDIVKTRHSDWWERKMVESLCSNNLLTDQNKESWRYFVPTTYNKALAGLQAVGMGFLVKKNNGFLDIEELEDICQDALGRLLIHFKPECAPYSKAPERTYYIGIVIKKYADAAEKKYKELQATQILRELQPTEEEEDTEIDAGYFPFIDNELAPLGNHRIPAFMYQHVFRYFLATGRLKNMGTTVLPCLQAVRRGSREEEPSFHDNHPRLQRHRYLVQAHRRKWMEACVTEQKNAHALLKHAPIRQPLHSILVLNWNQQLLCKKHSLHMEAYLSAPELMSHVLEQGIQEDASIYLTFNPEQQEHNTPTPGQPLAVPFAVQLVEKGVRQVCIGNEVGGKEALQVTTAVLSTGTYRFNLVNGQVPNRLLPLESYFREHRGYPSVASPDAITYTIGRPVEVSYFDQDLHQDVLGFH